MQHQSSLRAHARSALVLFAGLGLQVGAWSAAVAQLALDLSLSPGALGLALAAGACGGIVALTLAGRVVDRVGRRPIAISGALLLGAAWLGQGLVGSLAPAIALQALYGAGAGCLDLAANAVGSDVERVHAVRAMPRLHAAFSAAASLGALSGGAALEAGASRATLFGAVASVLAALAVAAAALPLPDSAERPAGRASGEGEPSRATREPSRATREPSRTAGEPSRSEPDRSVLALPGVLAATAIVTLCFFGDSALEGYAGIHLRTLVGAGPLAAGAAIAMFHAAGAVTRASIGPVLARCGERRVLPACGAIAAGAMSVVALAQAPAVAAVGLVIVGVALAPVVPVALSLAGRSAPRGSGRAVSTATAVGWGAFLGAPPIVGAVADATSLRVGLLLVVGSTTALALVAARTRGLSSG
jgi:MFS family permease